MIYRITFFYFLLVISNALDHTQYVVPCDHSTASCICPLYINSVKVEVCIFSLVVEALQTFTRYRIDPVTNQIALPHGGKAWYIKETTGELEPYPDNRTVCDELASNCTDPYTVDGYSYRTYFAVNGRLPGPSLIVNFNQTIVVNVTNKMDSESLSIHWHGMHQQKTNWMDGVQHLTQCGINPGNSFTYIFQADPMGTHWYHSQSGSQRNEGVFGALIVQEDIKIKDAVMRKLEIDFQDSPETHTLLFQDWQNDDVADILLLSTTNTRFYHLDDAPDPKHYTVPKDPLTSDGTELGPIQFWSGLINGRGRYGSIHYNKTRLSIFTVSAGTSYRFRLVGAQHLFAFMVSFDEHRLKVIGKDGIFVKPIDVDYLIIQPGERYDVILKGKPATHLSSKSNFMIRAETLEVQQSDNVEDVLQLTGNHKAEAILHYNISHEPLSIEYASIANDSIPVDSNCTAETPCVTLNCPFKAFPSTYNISCIHIHQLELLNEIPTDKLPNFVPDETFFFNFGFEGSAGSSSINAHNNQLPSSPLSLLNSTQLEKITDTEFCRGLSESGKCNDNVDQIFAKDCICSHVRNVSLNSSVMLVLSAIFPHEKDMPINHPSSHSIHLHGHYFHVVDMQFGNYSPTGRLTGPNKDISCGGGILCATPSWRNGHQLSSSITGKISGKSPLSDTITVPAGGYVVLYFQSNNPGFWYLHCESEVHHLPGMGAILAEAVDSIIPPPKGMKRCGHFLWTAEQYFKMLLGTGNPPHSKLKNNSYSLVYYLSGSLSFTALLLFIGIISIVCFIVYRKCATKNGLTKHYQHMELITDDVVEDDHVQ